MSIKMLITTLVTLLICFNPVLSLFQVPEVQIQAINPEGFRVSISAIYGIQSFQFRGKIGKEGKYIGGDEVREIKDRRFIFEDKITKLKIGDILNYWVFIEYEGIGFRKNNQLFEVKEFVRPDTPFSEPTPTAGISESEGCKPSLTTIGGQLTCKGHLLFEETFESPIINTNRWTVEHRLPSPEQECEFVSYQKSNINISNGTLQITPTLWKNHENGSKILDLNFKNECTSKLSTECSIKSGFQKIIPPVVSGKISTRDKFSFKYGRVEIEAKLPRGDWIYPELYLEPQSSEYGLEGYDSGIMRVAFARGNSKLINEKTGDTYGHDILSGGVIIDQTQTCRDVGIRMIKSADKIEGWGGSYHVFALTWRKDSIMLEVDGTAYGEIMPPTQGFKSMLQNKDCDNSKDYISWKSEMAPFDKEFCITIGLGVGGISDFPHVIIKPWDNEDPTAEITFADDIDNWYKTWKENEKDLHVKSIRVWAL